MKLALSSRGTHQIAAFEGYVPKPYNDTANNATIGFGHLIHYGPVTEQDIQRYSNFTFAAALGLLQKDAQVAVDAVNKGVTDRLGIIPANNQCRFDALVSFAFNIGAGGFLGSSALRLINEKGAPRDWSEVGPAIIAWDHDTENGSLVVNQGLLRRRTIEAHWFINAIYPTPNV
jgi:lysozyme